DGAPAAGVGRGRTPVAGRAAAPDRSRRLHRAPLYADRTLRAARPRRPEAPRVLGPPAARAAADSEREVRPPAVRGNRRRRNRTAADRRARHLRADRRRRVLQSAENAGATAAGGGRRRSAP